MSATVAATPDLGPLDGRRAGRRLPIPPFSIPLGLAGLGRAWTAASELLDAADTTASAGLRPCAIRTREARHERPNCAVLAGAMLWQSSLQGRWRPQRWDVSRQPESRMRRCCRCSCVAARASARPSTPISRRPGRAIAGRSCCAARPGSARPHCSTTWRSAARAVGSFARSVSSRRWSCRSRRSINCPNRFWMGSNGYRHHSERLWKQHSDSAQASLPIASSWGLPF